MPEIDKEHERRGYAAFRNELGSQGKHMSESELRQEVDTFLKVKGITLADVKLSDTATAPGKPAISLHGGGIRLN